MIDFGEFVVASVRGPWGVDEDSGLLGAMTRVNMRRQGKVTLEDLCSTLFHAGERLAVKHGLLSPQSSVEAHEDEGTITHMRNTCAQHYSVYHST